jgi:hypothetical protein
VEINHPLFLPPSVFLNEKRKKVKLEWMELKKLGKSCFHHLVCGGMGHMEVGFIIH